MNKAIKLKKNIRKILSNWTDILLKGLSDEEEEQLYILLEKISQNATKHDEDG